MTQWVPQKYVGFTKKLIFARTVVLLKQRYEVKNERNSRLGGNALYMYFFLS